MPIEYKVVKLYGEPDDDEKELKKLADGWELVAIVTMLGKLEPGKDIAHTEYHTWPVAYFKRTKRTEKEKKLVGASSHIQKL